jgi:hypothetical protein
MRRATASRWGGFLCLDAGCWILDAGYHDRRRATMCLSIPRSESSSSFPFRHRVTPSLPLGSRLIVAYPSSAKRSPGRRREGRRMARRHEQKEEEGGWEPLGRG